MKFDFKDIIWVAVVVLIVIYLSKCHRDNSHLLDDNIKRLQVKAEQDSVRYAQQVVQYQMQASSAQTNASEYASRNRIIEQQLDQRSATVLRLSAQLKSAKAWIDTTTIGVGQDYIDYCDSLAFESSDLAINFNKYKQNTKVIIEAKDLQISAKDSIIAIERQAKATCKTDYNALMHFYKQQSASIKPRNQLFVGAELISTPAYLINNVGVALSLKTKSNKLWQLSGGLQNNGKYYARINGNILITLKR